MEEHNVRNARKYQQTHQGQLLTENLLVLDVFEQRQVKNQIKYQMVSTRNQGCLQAPSSVVKAFLNDFKNSLALSSSEVI